MQVNIDIFSKLGDFLTMADGSFLGSRFLTDYRLQFSYEPSQISDLSFLGNEIWTDKKIRKLILVYI